MFWGVSWLTSCAAMVTSGSVLDESPSQCVAAAVPRKGSRVPAAWHLSLPYRTSEPHHIADHLGDRLVVLRRHLIIDLDRRVQRAGERRVLDHRDIVGGRDLADLECDIVDALGQTDRRAH